ncbi:beta-2-syntrophin isoform X1 [Falco rusticolus]|uniref:beta-2-syntrophin isoform X1 n=1 Tax=Falco rusticolus TaxID=120794 RepID=UPI0018866F7E|nr:beta-2-syntrophin isoform X1 [Falco rusticolus]
MQPHPRSGTSWLPDISNALAFPKRGSWCSPWEHRGLGEAGSTAPARPAGAGLGSRVLAPRRGSASAGLGGARGGMVREESEPMPPSFLPSLERSVEPGCPGCKPSSPRRERRQAAGRRWQARATQGQHTIGACGAGNLAAVSPAARAAQDGLQPDLPPGPLCFAAFPFLRPCRTQGCAASACPLHGAPLARRRVRPSGPCWSPSPTRGAVPPFLLPSTCSASQGVTSAPWGMGCAGAPQGGPRAGQDPLSAAGDRPPLWPERPWGAGLRHRCTGPPPGLNLCPLHPTVKFMREVTPYIKKPSLVSDLPWEGAAPQSPSLSGSEDSGSPQHQCPRDRKVIPLKMCFAARNLSMPDLENRLIELHSPDSRNTLILRCKDTATAHSWFTALHANIAALLPQVLAELNAMLGTGGTVAGGREVKHIAWLAEQARLDGGRQQWRPVLMAVTEKDLLLYDGMPWTRDAWASPCHSYPLVATRLVHSGSGRRSPALGCELTFATRTGSRQGVEMHVFRVETHRDLSSWTRVLVQGCHAAAELMKEVTVGCTLGGQEVQLSIHYEGGFTICREEPGSSVLFRYPYERLKMSADDGIRTLYLDFGGPEGELALDLHSCPKPIVFILHTFLSAKVTRMGLLA